MIGTEHFSFRATREGTMRITQNVVPPLAFRTRRGPRFEGSAAGETRVFCIHIKRKDEMCVAHPKKERLREGPLHPF